MDQEKIKSGLLFLQSMKDKNIPMAEKKKFLESKMSEEEIAEVIKRYEQLQTEKS